MIRVGHAAEAPEFPEAARLALSNQQLRANVRRATDVIRGKRAAVVGELADWQELREAGRQIKAHVLRHLGEYLQQFEENCIRSGGHVHWARDADEANALIVRIIESHGEREVIKVKTMTSDETRLNAALEAAGITPFETDRALDGRSRGLPPVAPSVRDRRAHESVQLHLDRNAGRWWRRGPWRKRRWSRGVPGEVSRATPDRTGRWCDRCRAGRRMVVPEAFPASVLPHDLEFSPDAGLSYDELDRCDGVVTMATIAIAMTGTIVLTHNGTEGRRALTLIPDYHVCVVGADQIVTTVPEAFQKLTANDPALVTTISGPSATADIEMIRVRGVHGPRTLDVIVVG